MIPRRSAWLRRVVWAWMAAVACMRWEPEMAPSQAPQGRLAREVRLSLRDGSRPLLLEAVIRGDSIMGRDTHHMDRAFALADVTTLKRGDINKTRTALLVFGVVAVIYIAKALSELSTMWEGGLQIE